MSAESNEGKTPLEVVEHPEEGGDAAPGAVSTEPEPSGASAGPEPGGGRGGVTKEPDPGGGRGGVSTEPDPGGGRGGVSTEPDPGGGRGGVSTEPDPGGGRGGGLRKVFWIAAFAILLLGVAALGTTGYLGQRELRDRVAALEGALASAESSLAAESDALRAERARADALQGTMGRVNELSKGLAASLTELQELTGSPAETSPDDIVLPGDESATTLPLGEASEANQDASTAAAPAADAEGEAPVETGAATDLSSDASVAESRDEALENATHPTQDTSESATAKAEGTTENATATAEDSGESVAAAIENEVVAESEDAPANLVDAADDTTGQAETQAGENTEALVTLPTPATHSTLATLPAEATPSILESNAPSGTESIEVAEEVESALAALGPRPDELPEVGTSPDAGDALASESEGGFFSWWEGVLDRLRSLAPSD